MNKRLINILFFLLIIPSLYASDTLSLAGNWRIVLDGNYREVRDRTGITQEWFKRELPTNSDVERLNRIYFKNRPFEVSDWILLPGTTDEAGIGGKLEYSSEFTTGLERLRTYDDAFWVQRKIHIPASWEGRRVTLFLERLLGESRAYWDGELVGKDYGYAYPHMIELDQAVKPGEHLLTLLINKNDYRYAQTGHHVINQNGCSWNGILGRMELISQRQEGYINSVQIYPDLGKKGIEVKMTVNGTNVQNIRFAVRPKGSGDFKKLSEKQLKGNTGDYFLEIPAPLALWNEFTPNLYELKSELVLSNGEIADVKTITFGMREIATKEGLITINGQKVFMRGTLECGTSPITGYPSMEKEEWLRIMNVCKSYGLNHIRFHTWCPPEAAFEAADEIGIYLQPELAGRPYTEIDRVLETYGNHPSFCMLSLNNEAFSHNAETREILQKAQAMDSRHLYSCTSHPASKDCVDDFYVSAGGANGKRIVGINHGGGNVVSTTRFNLFAPETASNYSTDIEGLNAPVISHEVGQWAMFPMLDEIGKYTGVLRNVNYERIKEEITAKGMLGQAKDFADASGKFSSVLYKEEIESALRTSNLAGFQLLDIHDFQGQYISLVGILNTFWESKGLVSAEKHSEYCNTVAPLALLPKRIWKTGETFEAGIQVANYGAGSLKSEVQWSLTDQRGNVLRKGKLPSRTINQGGLTDYGTIRFSCEGIKKAEQAVFKVLLPGSAIQNEWDIWIYPSVMDNKKEVTVIHGMSDRVFDALQQGQNVLLIPSPEDMKDHREPCFTTIFWNSFHKWPQKAHTMGILVDPEHPLFTHFPTDSHSNWQWWDICMNARAMKMNNFPVPFHPLIQVIDSHIINDKLAYMWECKAGKGKLIVCSVDFTTDMDNRPASGQLKYALMEYMNSDRFNPEVTLEFNTIRNILQ